MVSKNFTIVLVAFVLIAAVLISNNSERIPQYTESQIPKFASCTELKEAFGEARLKSGRGFGIEADILTAGAAIDVTIGSTAAQSESSSDSGAGQNGTDFSGTNIQVEGVDEADFLKTDGKFIYQLSQGNLAISQAYPVESAELFSLTKMDKDFNPQEMLVHKNALILFGQTYQKILYPEPIPTPMIGLPEISETIAEEIYPYPPYYQKNFTTVQLWDVTNKGNPELKRTIDFEGQYRESRKIGSDVYFVITGYPHYTIFESETDDVQVVPLLRDSSKNEEFEKIGGCETIGYLPPVRAESFITVASLDLDSFDSEIEKEIVVGSGQNVYASTNNLYFAETTYDYVIAEPLNKKIGILPRRSSQQTNIHKFSLDNGKIDYKGNGKAPGRILNQFSMDEFEKHFRIATTTDNALINGTRTTSNNVYVLDSELNLIGSLEDLAPGEQIFSARFMGNRLYLVTFQKIDPLFVIDLSEPKNPNLLGKLKIPGFSDYLHPFDDKHIIGVGKDALESEKGNFSWFQGVKLALFDVSDVQNPIQLHQQIIGDRGTESLALNDHKAFLFDREKELLVLPITLAEIKDKDISSRPNTRGEFVFQGAYVFNLTIENGFDLFGKITHYEDDQIFKKSGYYFYRNNNSVKRALYINDILFTVSDAKILGNSLNDLRQMVEINIPVKEKQDYYDW